MSRRTQPYKHGVPAKYLAGLSPEQAKRRAAEIKRTAKKYKQGKKVDINAISKSRASTAKRKRS